MVRFLRVLVLVLCMCPALAQEPTITWGPEIPHNRRNLNQLKVIGTGSENSFYTRYTENRQITLERYNRNNQRVWSIAIAPLSPEGKRAVFEELVVLNHQVYLLSSVTENYSKTIYAQQIDAKGNYMPTIHILASTTPDATIHAQTRETRLLLILQQKAEPQQTDVMLYQGSFKPSWTADLHLKGLIKEMQISATGNIFVLSELPASNSPEAAFFLYRFEGRSGRNTIQPVGSTALRPLQAKMEILNEDLIVAGLTAPAPFVASLAPEPTGTFYYRFPKGRFRNYIHHYAPIDSLFLHDYKAYKPDKDHSQRLRYLQLQHLLLLNSNHTVLLGEVYTLDRNQHHTDDVLLFAFDQNGEALYTASANKHQTGDVNQVRLGSYIATTAQDTVKLIYLDFEYNYNEQNEIMIATSRAVLKTPVLAKVAPDGKITVRPLRHTQTGRHQDFYLVPSASYKLSNTDFIVLGSGKGYYKFGRLRF